MGGTSLQKQLEKLAGGHRQETRLRKVASFLFEDKVAQQVSTSQCQKIGERGLKGLAELDTRFNHFFSTLFDVQSLETERTRMTGEDAASIDAEIDMFLWLMSPHFLLSCAHEATEYLLRHYEVHLIHTERILRAILPFHDHLFFARMVQLLPLRNTRWSFLWELQKKGRTLTRAALVQKIMDDASLFSQICEWTLGATEREADHPALLNLFNSLVVDLVSAFNRNAKGAADRFVGQVLPAAEVLVTTGRSLDSQASGYTAIATLFATTPLGQQVCIKTLLKLLSVMSAKGDERAVIPHEHICKVAALVASQIPLGVSLSQNEVSKFLHVKWDALSSHLELLQHSNEGAALMSLLLSEMVKDAIKSNGRRMSSLQHILESVELAERQGAVVASACLKAVVERTEEVPAIVDMLTLVERNCCKGFDTALRQCLDTSNKADKAKVFTWLTKRFSPSSEAHAQGVVSSGEEMYTVSVASMHPEPHVRQMAAKQLAEGLKKGNAGEASSMLLRMLDLEDNPTVLEPLLSEVSFAQSVNLAEALPVFSALSLEHTEPVATSTTVQLGVVLASLASRAAKEGHATAADYYVVLALFSARCTLAKGKLLKRTQTLLAKDACAALKGLAAGMDGGLEKLVAAVRSTKQNSDAILSCLRDAAESAASLRAKEDDNTAAYSTLETTAMLCTLFAEPSPQTFCAVRDHMQIVLRDVQIENPVRPQTNTMTLIEAGTTSGPEKVKLAYLSLLAAVLSSDPAQLGISDDEHLALSADSFELLTATEDANADVIVSSAFSAALARHSLPLIAGVWAKADVSSTVLLKSFNIAAPLLAQKVKNSGSQQLAAAALCLLTRKQEVVVLEALAVTLQGIAKNVGSGLAAFLKNLGPRLSDVSVQTFPQLVNDLNTDGAVVSLLADAGKWNMPVLAEALGAVASLAKVRTVLPTLEAALSSATLSATDGTLAADAARSLRALYSLSEKEWKALPDRKAIHEAFCKCLEHVAPIQVHTPQSSVWRYDTESAGAPENFSFPDIIADITVETSGVPVHGFETIFKSLNHEETQRWMDALLTLVSNGHAAGVRILEACRATIGQSLRLHAALLAGRWSKSLVATEPLRLEAAPEEEEDASASEEEFQPRLAGKRKAASGLPTTKRSKDDSTLSLPLCRAAEALLMLHPAQGMPLTGQDPVGVATFVWRCLRVESAKPRKDRSVYMISLFVTLLANCAAEYGACVAQAKEAGRSTDDVATIVPGIDAGDRRCDALCPLPGNLLVDLSELVEVLKSVNSAGIRREGMKVFRSLIPVNPAQVYGSCLQFVVEAVGITSVDDLLEEMLENLIPGLLSGEDGGSLVTLIHIVLYSFASRRGSSEAALDGCHTLLERCNVHFQLVALNKLLLLTVKDSPRTQQEEELLSSLGSYHPAALTQEQIEQRVVLFALRHLVSDTFIDAVLDEEDAQSGDSAFYESFTHLFLSLLQIYKQNGEDDDEEGANSSDEGSDSGMSEDVMDGDDANSDGSSALSGHRGEHDATVVDDLYNLSVPLLYRIKQMLVAVVDVMPIPVFVAAVQELLGDSGVGLRTLGLRLFNSKMDAIGDRLTHEDSLAFITMLPELKEVLDVSHEALAADSMAVQSALWTLEILTRHLAPLHPRSFAHFLPSITTVLAVFKEKLRESDAEACAVTSSAMLTLGHICQEIEALSLEHVPTVLPILLGVCGDATTVSSKLGLSKPKHSIKQLMESCCTCLTKVLKLGKFLSPYYSEIASIATSRGAVAVAKEGAEKLLRALLKSGTRRLLFPSLTQV